MLDQTLELVNTGAENPNRIISIEGISGSGKSTLTNKLIETKKWSLLYELPKKYNPLTEFPSFTVNTKEAIVANKWFIQREIERCAEAKNIQQRNNVVADRWFFSIFSVSYARYKLFGTQDYEGLEKTIEQLIKSRELFIPEIYILDAPLKTTMERLYKRYNHNTDRMNKLNLYEKFLKEQRQYYLLLSEEMSFPLLDGTKNPLLLMRYIE